MVALVGSLYLPWTAEREEGPETELANEAFEEENDTRKVPLIIKPPPVDSDKKGTSTRANVPFDFATNNARRKSATSTAVPSATKSIVDARKAVSSKESVSVNTVLALGPSKRKVVPEMLENSSAPADHQKAAIPDSQVNLTKLSLEQNPCVSSLHPVSSNPDLVSSRNPQIPADSGAAPSDSGDGVLELTLEDSRNRFHRSKSYRTSSPTKRERSLSFSRGRSGSLSKIRSGWNPPAAMSHVLLGKSVSYKSLRTVFGLHNSLGSSDGKRHWQIARQPGGNGGLFNAFKKAERSGQIEGLKWVGLLGTPTDSMDVDSRAQINEQLKEENCTAVFVTDSQWEGHYTNYCKEFLWPTFHAQVPDIPKARSYEESSWGDYKAVNQIVADGIVAAYSPGDTIIINDYHLMLVPAMVRAKLPNATIGFFMHISFPTSESFRCLAYRNDLLKGMLAADLIGFQNSEYAHHFLMTVARILAFDSVDNYIQTHDREVHVISCPIGIDSDRLDQILKSDAVKLQRQRIRESWPNVKIIGARDKLDSVRGLRHKLHAFSRFLKQNPDMASKVVLIQVLLSAASDSDLEAELASIADHINSTYGDVAAGIQPVVLLRQDVVFEQYVALIAEADAFAVTSLRDGMNLTCHEFIHCNERQGPVILSEFTGSATVLGDDALLVNPWDVKALAEVFYEAVIMNPLEQKRRSKQLRKIVAQHTSAAWIEFLTQETEAAWELNQQRSIRKPDFAKLQQLFKSENSGKKLFIIELPTARKPAELNSHELDIDRPALRRKSSQLFISDTSLPFYAERLEFVLRGMVNIPGNVIYVSSSESKLYMERVFRNLPSIGLIAEAGKYLKPPDCSEWRNATQVVESNPNWKEELQPMLKGMTLRLPVQNISIHESTVIIDFDKQHEVDEERRLSSIGEYVSVVEGAFSRFGVRSYFDNKSQLTIFSSLVLNMKAWALDTIVDLYPSKFDVVFAACQPLTVEADDYTFSQLEAWKHEGFTKDLVTMLLGSQKTRAQYNADGLHSLLTLLEALSSTN